MKQLGFPLGCGAGADAPYDYLADQLRGMKGSMLDMYRRPEKVANRGLPLLLDKVVFL